MPNFDKRLPDIPMTRLTTRPMTVHVPILNLSSGALVMMVFGIFSGRISKTASLILLLSSGVTVGILVVRDRESVVRDAMLMELEGREVHPA